MPAGRLSCDRVVAVGGRAALADLQQELAVLAELQDLPVAVAVASQPDVILVVDGDPMLAAAGTSIAIEAPFGLAGLALHVRGVQPATIEPFVLAFGGAAPSQDVAASRAELQDGRRRLVAILRRVAFFQRVRAMKHPDIAVGIRGRATDAPQQHMGRAWWGNWSPLRRPAGPDPRPALVLRGGGSLEPRPAGTGHECDNR